MLSATKEMKKMLTKCMSFKRDMCLDMSANTSYLLNALKNKFSIKVYHPKDSGWLCSMG